MVRIGALVSGRGSNLQAIVDAGARRELNAQVVVVISNVADAYALERARAHRIDALFVNHRDFPDRAAFEARLIGELDAHEVGLVCLAGFMRILSPVFVRHYPLRIMNIHPALLPAFAGFYGHHVHEAVLKSGARFSGCTVHFVTEEVDGGPIVVQRVVPVLGCDTPDELAARVLVEEHKAYVEAIRLFAAGALDVDGKRVKVRE